MYSNKFKKFIILLSLSSFILALLIGSLVLTLLLNEGPLNIVSQPLAGIKICIAAVVVQCLFIYVISIIYRPDHIDYEENLHFQLYSIIKSCGLLFLASLIFHVLSILYGAPVLTSFEETYTFSVLMTVLIILPLCIFCGSVLENWYNLFTTSWCLGVETIVYYTSILSIIGAWAGAAVIPLDWDRPWQTDVRETNAAAVVAGERLVMGMVYYLAVYPSLFLSSDNFSQSGFAWPISCAVGGVSGYCVGLLLGAIHLPRELVKSKTKRF